MLLLDDASRLYRFATGIPWETLVGMKRIALLTAVLAVGCKSSVSVDEFRKYKEQACACKEQACIEDVDKRFSHLDGKIGSLSSSEQEEAMKLGLEALDCAVALVSKKIDEDIKVLDKEIDEAIKSLDNDLEEALGSMNDDLDALTKPLDVDSDNRKSLHKDIDGATRSMDRALGEAVGAALTDADE